MASSRIEFDDFFGDDDGPEVPDTKAEGRLLRVPLKRMSRNYVNPRENFGTEHELLDFGKSLQRRQIQAVPVVSRQAYLKLWPDNKKRVGSVDFVIVSGERRFRGASAVGMQALDCVVNDELAADRRTFLNAVVSENLDRQNFDAIEEAIAVDSLVEAFGTARAVAEHYERGDGWVSQRRILLKLAPQVQDLVRTKELPLEMARKLGKLVKDNSLSESEQLAWTREQKDRREAESNERREARRTTKSPRPPKEGPGDPGQGEGAQGAGPSDKANVQGRGAQKGAAPANGSSRSGRGDDVPSGAMPWNDPAAVVRIAKARMSNEDFQTAGKLWNELLKS